MLIGINSEEVDTNNQYERNLISERSIRLITDTPEHKATGISR